MPVTTTRTDEGERSLITLSGESFDAVQLAVEGYQPPFDGGKVAWSQFSLPKFDRDSRRWIASGQVLWAKEMA